MNYEPISFWYIRTKAGALALALFVFIGLSGCRDADAPLLIEEGEQLPGGQVSINDIGPNAFGHQAPGLTGLAELEFFVGNSFFNQNWVGSPASTTARDGLGPLFNARACSACHFKDGRGRPPAHPGEKGAGLLLRIGYEEGGELIADPHYGLQLQDQAIGGVPVEANYVINYVEETGYYADGTAYHLRRPEYIIQNTEYGDFRSDLLISPRVANQVIGLGLLEAIPEEALLSYEDPGDYDGDGVSGRANWVPEVATGKTVMGRFGWKANQPDLRQQSAAAFIGDMGITTSIFPNDNCTSTQMDCQAAPNGDDGEHEISNDDLRKVVLYVSTLAVPVRRQYDQPEVIRGKRLFHNIGCTACHVPTFKTGQHPTIDALSDQKIWPYTDLLLHDMGPGLADGMPDFEADGNEWRTPPLWGIGLFQTVSGHTNYLHDGRARNLAEAVLWHDGEAFNSREGFRKLSKSERDDLLAFLNSL
ncbi:MAG: di-heme oxidoredictase family protein [Bacteroidota bacterium]